MRGDEPEVGTGEVGATQYSRTDGVESTTYNYYYYDTEYSPHMREDSYAKALLQAKLI